VKKPPRKKNAKMPVSIKRIEAIAMIQLSDTKWNIRKVNYHSETLENEMLTSLTARHLRSRREVDSTVEKVVGATECANFTSIVRYEDEYRVLKNFSMMYQGRMYYDFQYRATDDGLQVCNSSEPRIHQKWQDFIVREKQMTFKQCNVSVDGFYFENYTLYKNLTVFLKPTQQSFTREDYGVVYGHFVICSAKLSLSCNDDLLEVKYSEEYLVFNNFSLFYNNKMYDYRQYRFSYDSLEICSSKDSRVQAIWKTRNSWMKFKEFYKCRRSGHYLKTLYYIVNKQFNVYLATTGHHFTRNKYALVDGKPIMCKENLEPATTEYTQEDLQMCNDSIIHIKYDDEYKVWNDFSILYMNKVNDYTEYRVLNDGIKICNSTDDYVRSSWKLRTAWVKEQKHFKSCTYPAKNVFINKGFYTVRKDFNVVLFPSLQVIPRNHYGVSQGKPVICLEKLLYPTVRDINIFIAPLAALALSFVCSLLLLIVYCLIPELRTLPGLNLMSLTFALLLWQIDRVVYFSMYMRLGSVYKIPCATLIIAAKFSTYTILMNTTVSIYHLKKTFCGNTLVKSDEKKWKTFLKYSSFSWGVPLLIVTVYILLVQEKVLRFEQVPLTGACISNHHYWSLILDAVGLPFGIFFCIIVMFSYTAYRIRQKLKTSSSIAQKSNIVKSRNSFVLLLKLSTTAFISCTPLIYENLNFNFRIKMAVVTVTWLSGVYVGIAFVFTRKNYQLLKRIFSKKIFSS
jgi:hypothetical protein